MTKDIDALVERLKQGQDLLRLFVSSWNPRQSGKTSAGQLIVDIEEAIQALTSQQHNGSYREVWLVVDKDGDIELGAKTQEQADSYVDIENSMKYSKEQQPYKAVKAYIMEGE